MFNWREKVALSPGEALRVDGSSREGFMQEIDVYNCSIIDAAEWWSVKLGLQITPPYGAFDAPYQSRKPMLLEKSWLMKVGLLDIETSSNDFV